MLTPESFPKAFAHLTGIGVAALVALLPPSSRAQNSTEPERSMPGVIVEGFESRKKGFRDLNLYLRYPHGRGKKEVDGVLAICLYGERGLQGWSLNSQSSRFGHLINLADRHNLAVVAFGQPAAGAWNRTVSSSDLTGREASQQDRKLDTFSREWSKIINQFSARHDLPSKEWLLYGICGGAQYAHRLALREPQHFLAVHAHYGGSYDVPTPQAANLLWLVTTWADEPAYDAAQRFFKACREANYPIILKGLKRQGTADPDGSVGFDGMPLFGQRRNAQLSVTFFEYALEKRDREKELPRGQARPEPIAYIGDFVNEMVVPAEQAQWIPKSQQVPLPTRKLAEAWGPIEE